MRTRRPDFPDRTDLHLRRWNDKRTTLTPGGIMPSTLTADARNRAIRSFVQGLAIDVGVAVAVALYAIATDPAPIVWAIVGASMARTVVQSGAAYVMRRYLDPSSMPTPLPPANPGPPAENHPLNGRV